MPPDDETMIQTTQQMLSMITRQSRPTQWAVCHAVLGGCYVYRRMGDRAENVELAIHHYQQASQVFNRQDDPEKWALLQNDLGEAYRDQVMYVGLTRARGHVMVVGAND